MPHWCNTLYKATGSKENVDRLANTMVELGNMSRPGLVENGFGSSWLGNLVAKVGGVLDSSFCRGEWFIDSPEQPVVDGVFSFSVTSAWAEMKEWRQFVESRFDVKLIFLAEELGSLVFETNDTEHHFFSDEYYLRFGFGGSSDSAYYDSLKSLIAEVQNVTGFSGLTSYEDCERALLDLQKKDSSFDYFLIKFSYVE